MFRILVADDEKVTRRGIVTMLKRDLHEEIECLEAGNGQEALQIVSSRMVDLIITDICMPLCSGLEFVEQLRAMNREMTVLIISGYDNFEYARQAVRLGVKDYIMKPLRKEAFLDLVENCIAEIQKQQMAVREQSQAYLKQASLMSEVRDESLAALIRGEQTDQQIQRLKAMDEIADGKFFAVAVLQYDAVPEVSDCIDFVVKNITDECLQKRGLRQHGQTPDPARAPQGRAAELSAAAGRGGLTEDVVFQSVAAGQHELAIMFSLESTEQRGIIERALLETADIIRQTARVKAAVGTGEMVYTLNDLNRAYETAKTAADFKIYGMGRSLVSCQEIDKNGLLDEKTAARKWPRPSEENLQEIQKLFSEQMKGDPGAAELRQLRADFDALCALISDRLRSRGAKEWSGKTFSELWDEFDLRREIRDRILYLESTKAESTTEQSGLLPEIIAFTREHVTEEIDLNFLADHFGKSTGYIGTLFRRGYGQGFNEFVTAERMKLAQHLLLDRALTVQDVAKKCGYYNTKYFSVVFRKVTGTSPKNYQMNAGR
ncbi:MAG: response regulator [Eubacterium sp.]|nr:response regulator [Eubacterium sp.]